MRKLMLLGAMLAMVLVAAAPAAAQLVPQEFEQEDVESGGVAPEVEIANKGNNVNLCAAVLQQAQSGNVLNEQGIPQYASKTDDIEFEGSTISITPELVEECTQTIQQAAAAAAAPKGEAKAEAPKAEAKAGKAEAKAGGGAEAKAGKAEAKALPKTGGVAGVTSLVGLGAVALLVAGGLLARRIIR